MRAMALNPPISAFILFVKLLFPLHSYAVRRCPTVVLKCILDPFGALMRRISCSELHTVIKSSSYFTTPCWHRSCLKLKKDACGLVVAASFLLQATHITTILCTPYTMVVNKALDYTPQFTMSTIQFPSETVNLIISSLLTVLILVNIGSAVSKLVYFTRQTRFNYHSWLRAFIFANSDDPIRIFSWVFRRYAYRDRKWIRARTHLRPSRLIVPLLARFAVLAASIASVAVTIPGEKVLKGCDRGDYRLRWDPTQATFSDIGVSACIDVPLTSSRGSVRASASYCQCPNYSGNELDLDDDEAFVTTGRVTSTGELAMLLSYKNETYGMSFYVEWKESDAQGVTYRSNIDLLDLETQMQIAVTAIRREYSGCTRNDVGTRTLDGLEAQFVKLTNCELQNPGAMRIVLESHFRNALVWEPVASRERRIKIAKPDNGLDVSFSEDCPLRVIVTRPVVNLVPLAITLVLWCIVNILVSYAVSKHANVLDAAFHIIQETLGHDSQANPLEENKARDEIMHLDLYKWKCTSSGGGHVGFIGRRGDYPVNEFDENLVIGGCTQARTDLEAMRALVPKSPGGPGTSGGSAMNANPVRRSSVVTTPVPSTPSTGAPGLSGAFPGAPASPPPAHLPPTAHTSVPQHGRSWAWSTGTTHGWGQNATAPQPTPHVQSPGSSTPGVP